MLVVVVGLATMSAPRMDVDLAVIGAGTGGLAAARAGVRRRLRALIVTDGPIGGECTFTGCVPSKSLIEAAARGAPFADAMAWVHRNVDVIAARDTAEGLRGEGIEVLEGRARFVGRRTLEVHGRAVRAQEHFNIGPAGISWKLVNHVGTDDRTTIETDDSGRGRAQFGHL